MCPKTLSLRCHVRGRVGGLPSPKSPNPNPVITRQLEPTLEQSKTELSGHPQRVSSSHLLPLSAKPCSNSPNPRLVFRSSVSLMSSRVASIMTGRSTLRLGTGLQRQLKVSLPLHCCCIRLRDQSEARLSQMDSQRHTSAGGS